MSRNYSLEANLNKTTDFIRISGFSGILLSSFLLLSPAKSVGYIGIGAGLSAVGVSILGRNGYVKAVENHINELKAAKDSELKEKNEKIYASEGEIKQLKTQIKTLDREKELQINEKIQLELELKNAREQINDLSNQYDRFKRDWEAYTQQLENSISSANQAVSEAIEEWQKKITLLASTKTDYSKLAERLVELLKEGQDILDCYSQKLDEAKTKVNSLDDLLSIYFCLNDEMVGIKTRMIKSINTLSVQEKELDLDESYGTYEGLKEKYVALQKQYNQTVKEANTELMRLKGDCDSRIQEFLVVAEKEVDKTWSENEDFFKQLKETIQTLEKQVTILSKPLEYRPAIRADMVIGNVLIRYFHALGVILDRSHSDFRGYEATLWFFVDRNQRMPLASELNEHSERLQQLSHTLNSPQFELDAESGLIKVLVQWQRKPTISNDTLKQIVGSPEEFVAYVINHPIRYRLIADPGMGKSPTAAVMVSEILKVGCKRGNVPKGSKVPYTLVTVSYPGVQSSLKDTEYPLDLFLEYGTEASAVKSFQVALEDWEYRRKNIPYAEQFFQLWVWDEFDNTVNSASDPQALADKLKLLLKQGGHNNIGWIVSGQSVMTKQIPGFTNDDRSLFTEIIIGIPKIRHYLNTYGKGKNSDSNLAKLSKNLEQIEEYIEQQNARVTDEARLLRVALIVDSRSPKLYFLPNLDCVSFDPDTVAETRRLAAQFRDGSIGMAVSRSVPPDGSNCYTVSLSSLPSEPEKLPIGGRESKPHCPECGSANVKPQSQKRYKCDDCGVRRVESKMVWK